MNTIIKEKKSKNLVRIVYNPYNKPAKEILKFWIPVEYQKDVYAYNIK